MSRGRTKASGNVAPQRDRVRRTNHKSEGTGEKRRPPCRHGGLEFREETPKEGICGRSCRTATISSLTAAVASVFFAMWIADRQIRSTVAFLSDPDNGEKKEK